MGLYKNYPKLRKQKPYIDEAIQTIISTYCNAGAVFLCGNGGSATDCDHFAAELMKSFRFKRRFPDSIPSMVKLNLEPGLAAISLPSMTGINTAFANDVNYEFAFAQLVYSLMQPDDTLICFSTSGDSANIVNAAAIAKLINRNVISFTGKNECELDKVSNVCIKAPSTKTHRIQEYHLPIYHHIAAKVEKRCFERTKP